MWRTRALPPPALPRPVKSAKDESSWRAAMVRTFRADGATPGSANGLAGDALGEQAETTSARTTQAGLRSLCKWVGRTRSSQGRGMLAENGFEYSNLFEALEPMLMGSAGPTAGRAT